MKMVYKIISIVISFVILSGVIFVLFAPKPLMSRVVQFTPSFLFSSVCFLKGGAITILRDGDGPYAPQYLCMNRTPFKDVGKSCQSAEDCQGVCLLPDHLSPIEPGQCSSILFTHSYP